MKSVFPFLILIFGIGYEVNWLNFYFYKFSVVEINFLFALEISTMYFILFY